MKKFFDREKIEYFATLPWCEAYIKNSNKWQRESAGREVFGVTVFLLPYFIAEEGGKRNISLYAVSEDYHMYFSQLFARAQNQIQGEILGFCDNSPLDDRKMALDGGLGVLGKNGLVINEKYGSFVFIGAFVHLSPVAVSVAVEHKNCLGCEKCKKACPAGCVGGSFDGCLSGLTQKKKRDERENAMLLKGKLIWGCDICQEVCPMNQRVSETPLDFFRKNRIEKLTLDILDDLVAKDKLKTRAFGWRGEGLLRENLAIFEEEKKIF